MSALLEVLIALLVSLLVAGRVQAAARERRAVAETDEIVAWLRSMRPPPAPLWGEDMLRRDLAMWRIRREIGYAALVQRPGAAVIVTGI